MADDRFKNDIRSFGMSGYLITEQIKEIENRFGIDLGHLPKSNSSTATEYYTQFEETVRTEAERMSRHYELFYCLETSIRKLIAETLSDNEGANWWSSTRVPQNIRDGATKREQKELDSGVTRRSDDPIDYTNFGELSVLITANWDLFGAIFKSRRGVERVMSSLNILRGPIAHWCPITDDEVDRLVLTVKDWFRTMA